LERKDFLKAGMSPYPKIGHILTKSDVELVILLKPLEDHNVEGVSLKADTKTKPIIKLRQPDEQQKDPESTVPLQTSDASRETFSGAPEQLSGEARTGSSSQHPKSRSRLHLPPMWRTFGFDEDISPPLRPTDGEVDTSADGKGKMSSSLQGNDNDVDLDVD
jgi:hypothetical protein